MEPLVFDLFEGSSAHTELLNLLILKKKGDKEALAEYSETFAVDAESFYYSETEVGDTVMGAMVMGDAFIENHVLYLSAFENCTLDLHEMPDVYPTGKLLALVTRDLESDEVQLVCYHLNYIKDKNIAQQD